MSQGWDLLVPGEVFQHTVQEGDADGNGDFGQWRSMGAKMSQGWDLLVPGEVFQHTVQEGDADGNGDFGQWRSMGAKIRQPAQNLRIALQLLEPGDLRMMGRQITEEVAKRFLVDPSGSVAEGSGERLRRTCKQWFQWMAEGLVMSHD